MRSVEELIFPHRSLDKIELQKLAQFKKVKELDLSGVDLTETIFPILKEMDALEYIKLDGTGMTLEKLELGKQKFSLTFDSDIEVESRASGLFDELNRTIVDLFPPPFNQPSDLFPETTSGSVKEKNLAIRWVEKFYKRFKR